MTGVKNTHNTGKTDGSIIAETARGRTNPWCELSDLEAVGYRRISGRNQLVGRIVEVKSSGLVAQVVISIGGQHITSLITADAAREMGLKIGETAAALIKATEVMIIRV